MVGVQKIFYSVLEAIVEMDSSSENERMLLNPSTWIVICNLYIGYIHTYIFQESTSKANANINKIISF